MWIEPNQTVCGVGSRFNITIWMTITQDVFAYQIALHYNRTQLSCTRAGFTDEVTSDYFSGHATVQGGPVIDTGYLGNGSIMAYESCLGNDFVVGPKSASLVWAEFQVLIVPCVGGFGSKLDISTEYPLNTWVVDEDLNKITVTPYDGNFTTPLQTVLFFNISPNPASHGQTIAVKGILIDETHSLLPNQNIELYESPLGGSWQYIGSANTNASGMFIWQATIPKTVKAGTFVFAAYYPGTTIYLATYNFAILVIR
jgi:hypothetical protein